MVAWTVKGFGGENPRTASRLLPDSAAEDAWNCDLQSGVLAGLPTPELIADLTASPGTVRRAYRFPAPTISDAELWVPLPSEFSSVCRSPLANDTAHRIYWTNPTEGAFWNTYARLAAASPNYNLGFIFPDPGITPTLSASGGTAPGTVPYIERAYVFTYINEYGEESSPSNPSPVVAGATDGTWVLGNLPTTAPTSPVGKNYPVAVTLRVYRTVVGATTGAQYYQVADTVFGSSNYVDTVPDSTVVNNLTLRSTGWENPPAALDGLTAMPGGMLVGFTDNTVHFCEANRPHTWPAAYDQSLQYKIVGLGVWQQSLVALTEGFPSTGTGNSPANFTFTAVQVPEPCIARGSIITDLLGVYYASQNGLIVLNYFGMQNQTINTFTQKKWTEEFKAADIVACRHRAQFLAINGTGLGFLIDYAEPRLGVENLNTFNAAVCVWNDPYTGAAYIIADKKVYRWDSPDTGPLNYRWRSKQFYAPKDINLGAALVACDSDILVAPPAPVAPPLNSADTRLVLAAGVNAIFHLYADGVLRHTKILTKVEEEFRLPSGFKATVWQWEIVGRVTVHEVTIAETMKELKNG